ncbi:peptidoglycan-binding domain-containing protein [Streptomyces goshikiensis]|uniref:peptidoglycan-binding domain-containing protein n=1 Tax=Streptomyces goshikiensis TaxID=1942 RepID=UPI0033EBCE93
MQKLQRLLAAHGMYKGKINGEFDQRVKIAVLQFQIDQAIRGDNRGAYGPETRQALEG